MVEQLRRSNSAKAIMAGVVLAIGLATSGCGKDTGGRVPVAGEVTLDGMPLDKGTIEFHPTSGSGFTGGVISDGKFEIPAEKGALPGEYVVKIYATGELLEPEVDPDEPPGPEAEDRPLPSERIPARYNAESELTATVGEEGATDLQFDLES